MIALPCGELRHQHAMRIRVGAEPRLDLGDGLGVADQRHAQCRGGGLPRVVVGRRADAAELNTRSLEDSVSRSSAVRRPRSSPS